MGKRIGYKEMQANNKLSSYIERTTQDVTIQEIKGRKRCKVCDNIISSMIIDNDLCIHCQTKRGTKC